MCRTRLQLRRAAQQPPEPRGRCLVRQRPRAVAHERACSGTLLVSPASVLPDSWYSWASDWLHPGVVAPAILLGTCRPQFDSGCRRLKHGRPSGCCRRTADGRDDAAVQAAGADGGRRLGDPPDGGARRRLHPSFQRVLHVHLKVGALQAV